MNNPDEDNPSLGNVGAAERRFEDYRAAFRREGQRLVTLMSVYRRIHERRHDRLDALNVAPAFFQSVLVAHHTTIVVSAHGLFNGSGGEESLRTFLNFVARHLWLLSVENLARRRGWSMGDEYTRGRIAPTIDVVREDRRRLDRLEGLKSIAKLRHKIYAHLDSEYFFDRTRMADQAPLRWEHLTEIRETLTSILNRYSRAYDANTFEFVPTNVFDVDNVIEILHRSVEDE